MGHTRPKKRWHLLSGCLRRRRRRSRCGSRDGTERGRPWDRERDSDLTLGERDWAGRGILRSTKRLPRAGLGGVVGDARLRAMTHI